MRIVVALGGNALGGDPKTQIENAKLTAKYLAPIIEMGHEVIITHGNGPQVGLINLAFDEGHKINANVYDMGFSECGAMSQGYISFHLGNALTNELKERHTKNDVVAIVTNIVVDKNDPAFLNPTKPIGSFYSKDEAEKMPYPMKEDAGRGYRRVIASPKPLKIVEEKQIINLVKAGFTVICCGGGGIPVIEENYKYIGIDAVIDKDFASSKLADDINADMLMILTAVENAKINFGKPNELDLHHINADKLYKYMKNNEFKSGSMLPKVQACLNFVEMNKNRIAIITNIESAISAINFKKGTIIKNN